MHDSHEILQYTVGLPIWGAAQKSKPAIKYAIN